ncbi:hypothetical protein [Xanthomonas sp. F1]
MITHPAPLPRCRAGHTARHIHDARRIGAGGGHLIECPCSQTGKHAEFDDALRQWCRQHGQPVPALPPQRALPLSNVAPIRRATP